MLAAAQDDGLVMLIPLAVVAVVLLIAGITAKLYQEKRLHVLRFVAAHWTGRVHNPGMFGYPHAELHIQGVTARLQFTKVGKKRFYTELTIHFPDPRLRLEIYPQTVFHQLRKLLGMQDIEVGIPALDDAFIIQGNDPLLIREYLSRETQPLLQGLADFTFFRNLHVSIGGGTLRVTKQPHLLSQKDLTEFVTLVERLFTALLNTRTVGIEFLPATIPTARPNSHCQVCGEGLGGKIVHCASCRTPHHLDCWQYVGHCSVYACGEKRYRA